MAISTVDGLIAALPGQNLLYLKPYPALQAAGQVYSPWMIAGIPGAGTAPSSGVAGNTLDQSVAGSMPFANAASGVMYIARMAATCNVSGHLVLYDRLWHNSGLSPTLLTAQTVNSVTLPSRCPVLSDATAESFDTLGNRVEAWMQPLTTMGAGSTPPTISYTDESGNAGSTGSASPDFASAAAVNRAFRFTLAAGDTGIRSIQSYTNGATMTSGTFTLILRRRIASIPVASANSGAYVDWSQIGLPAIAPSSHLEFLWLPNGTGSATLQGDAALIGG